VGPEVKRELGTKELPRVCEYCHLSEKKLAKCKCGGICYCSEDCAQKDKKYHKTLCDYLSSTYLNLKKEKMPEDPLKIDPEQKPLYYVKFKGEIIPLDCYDGTERAEGNELDEYGKFGEGACFIPPIANYFHWVIGPDNMDPLIARGDLIFDKVKIYAVEKLARKRGIQGLRERCWKEKARIRKWMGWKQTSKQKKERKCDTTVPTVIAPSSLPFLCFGCRKEATYLFRCPCGFAYYCGLDCQKPHYKDHKLPCRYFTGKKLVKDLPSLPSAEEAYIVVDLVRRKKKEGELQEEQEEKLLNTSLWKTYLKEDKSHWTVALYLLDLVARERRLQDVRNFVKLSLEGREREWVKGA